MVDAIVRICTQLQFQGKCNTPNVQALQRCSVFQLAGYTFLFLHIQGTFDFSKASPKSWELALGAVLSLLLISARYWENFVAVDFKICGYNMIPYLNTQRQLDRTRFKTSLLYSFIRMAIMVSFCFLIHMSIMGHEMPHNFTSERVRGKCTEVVTSLWYAVITHTLCGLGAFYFGRIACQTMVQIQSYTLPLLMVTPIMAALTTACDYSRKDLLDFFGITAYSNEVKLYLNWNMNGPIPDQASGAAIAGIVIAGLILGWLALVFITVPYLWKPQNDRLEKTEVLFVKAIYGGVLINEELMFNRRQYQSKYAKMKKIDDAKYLERQQSSRGSKRRRSTRRKTMHNNNRKFIPQVFLCATMWHENKQEMTQLLTSIMRLDKDQGLRRPTSRKDKDFYQFQVHILFDDAMEKTPQGAKPNKFVNLLIDTIPVAANKVDLGSGDLIHAPVIYPTPYGGRLEYVMPHGNLMIVHLKDKSMIRHRKRWSQCMYMYFILGYLQETKKAYKKEDVFLLALDGDVDFQPQSMILLLDRMKKNPDVGAACGRIHPIGSGPVVWFQKFEYAVGHWLQKTAEHVLGCVLCSPGCFSLFRGEALTDINVVKMYTTKATEALHYIQWDQGEDRWLCTLLLKQGWRIEYSAASDSYTYAPEEFKEFYNQRRRWGPSTMANVFDILINSSLTIRNNMYISWGYIAYQMGLMASTILGPATVILVVQGGFAYVFSISAGTALIISLVPVIVFIILCYTTSPDFQIAVAGILTIVYALVMMAVLVGIIGQMTEALLNPNSIFMLAMIGIYAFTGIIHPTEMLCLLHGLLYYLCVPSAFILLMVYSLCNMNNVSWGTREVKAPVIDTEAQQQALQEVANKSKKKQKGGKNIQIGPSSDVQMGAGNDYCSCGISNLFQCALCIQPVPVYAPVPTVDPAEERRIRRTTLHRKSVTGAVRRNTIRHYSRVKAEFQERPQDEVENSLNRRISVMEFRQMYDNDKLKNLNTTELRRVSARRLTQVNRRASQARQLSSELEQLRSEEHHSPMEDYDEEFYEAPGDEDRAFGEDREGLYWIIEGPMEDGIIEYLDDKEHEFWTGLIKKYLEPLDEDKAEQARIKADLITLRNKMTGAYFLINSLWIVLTFALTLAIQDINITFVANGQEIILQPLSFLFLIFFLVILVIQFVTMLIHRWSTFVHLLAATTFDWSKSLYSHKTTNYGDNGDKPKKEKKKKNSQEVVNPAEVIENQTYADSNFTYGDTRGENHVDGNSDSDADDRVRESQYAELDVEPYHMSGLKNNTAGGIADSLRQVTKNPIISVEDVTYDVINENGFNAINLSDRSSKEETSDEDTLDIEFEKGFREISERATAKNTGVRFEDTQM